VKEDAKSFGEKTEVAEDFKDLEDEAVNLVKE